MFPDIGMALAAGLGTRMRPLTLTTPKPLLDVGGRSMLDRALDHFAAAGLRRAVVNAFYLKEQIADRTALRQAQTPGGMEFILSEEEAALETGGGVFRALPHLGDRPFFTANADIIWRDGPGGPALRRLAQAWDDDAMDALLLLARRDGAFGYDGPGDFFCDSDGAPLRRRGEAAAAPYVFAGVQIIRPQAFAGFSDGAFSLNRVWDRLAAKGRLRGLVHDGGWWHVGDPAALEQADAQLRQIEGQGDEGKDGGR